MTAPTYPLSTDVVSGGATLSSQYNNLRADALRLGAVAADALPLGTVLSRYSQWVRLEYLAVNRVRVPYAGTRKPSLVIDGFLCQLVASADLAAAPTGPAARYYVFANRTGGATEFTLSANTSPTESASQRVIGEFYWDGASIEQGSVRSEELERPGYVQVGVDAEKSTSPAAGDVYIATDASCVYVCLVAGAWVAVATSAAVIAAHAAVTIADSTSIDLSLVGQQISAAAVFGTDAGTVAQGNDTRITGAAQKVNSFRNITITTSYP